MPCSGKASLCLTRLATVREACYMYQSRLHTLQAVIVSDLSARRTEQSNEKAMTHANTFFIFIITCHLCLCATATPYTPNIQVRNVNGLTSDETYSAVRKGLAVARLEKRASFRGNQTLERSWSGATLLSVYDACTLFSW